FAFAQGAGPASPRPIGDGPRLVPLHDSARAATTEGGMMFPDGAVHFDNYSGYTLTDLTNPPASLVPLGGQLNSAGIAWSTTDFFGVANAQTLLAVGATPPAGSPPHGLLTTRYAMSARGSLDTGYNPKFGILG